ncbi:sugar ABC transporter ATP-binding protein [Frankia gtarii]|uniref:sugar ABC transporter ATP-binding protein n=1 Tax=Frankia gtarii TaxID=2950102 RepID=UPI0021BFBA73|nr:sugar ABC transporter ATP-binding protein [Frankia gtarii]
MPSRPAPAATTPPASPSDPLPASLVVSGLRKSFAGHPAVDSVDMTIAPGEIHALLGENGSGKSTFIKILSGYHRPDAGQATVAGRPLRFGSVDASYQLGCRFVHQDLGLVDACSVVDNLSLSAGYPLAFGTIRGGEARRIAQESLRRVGVDVDVRRRAAELSPALRTGVAVARALRRDVSAPAHLLVLDEPTATLPHDQVDQLLEIVRQVAALGVGVLYVSHRLAEVRRLADTVTVLRDGRRVAQRRMADLSHGELVDLLTDGHAVAAARPRHAEPGKVLLSARHVRSGHLRDLSFQVRSGEVLGIAGLSGSGREMALASLFGAVMRDAGLVRVDDTDLAPGRPDRAIAAGLAYLPPDRKTHGGIMTLSAAHNIALTDLRPFWKRLRLRRRPEIAETHRWFSALAIRPARATTARLETFSGGNQQKILFAKWLRRRPRVLLLDEPTQGVDIAAKADLHEQIRRAAAEGGAVVVSSADLEELGAVSSRVLVIRDGHIVAELGHDEATVPTMLRHSLGGESGRT